MLKIRGFHIVWYQYSYRSGRWSIDALASRAPNLFLLDALLSRLGGMMYDSKIMTGE